MTRFLVDGMCGGVLSYLRMCGHDAAFVQDRGLEADEEIANAARAEDRAVITRDRSLAAAAEESILLEVLDPEEQLAALAAAGVDLELPDEPTRCGRCNGLLREVQAAESTDEYAPNPAEEPVWRCEECGQYFWRGSHWDRVASTLGRL